MIFPKIVSMNNKPKQKKPIKQVRKPLINVPKSSGCGCGRKIT